MPEGDTAASQGCCPAVLLVAARDAVKIEQEPIGDPNAHIQDVTVHKTLAERALLVHNGTEPPGREILE